MTGPRFSFRLPPTGLTPDDLEVIHLMALGMNDRMIATVRGNATRTVKSRFSAIHKKLGTGNRIGILREVGWLKVPPEDYT